MNDLIELLFEGVAIDRLDESIGLLLSESVLSSVTASESPDLDLASWQGRVLEILQGAAPSPSAISFSLDKVKLGSVTIVSPLVQVFMVQESVDISLSFLDCELRFDSLNGLDALHHASLKFLGFTGGSHVLCGYEPASDHETRFFTDAIRGPLRDFW